MGSGAGPAENVAEEEGIPTLSLLVLFGLDGAGAIAGGFVHAGKWSTAVLWWLTSPDQVGHCWWKHQSEQRHQSGVWGCVSITAVLRRLGRRIINQL